MGALKLYSLTTRCRGWQSAPVKLDEAATVEVELGYDEFEEQIDRTAAGAIEETLRDNSR